MTREEITNELKEIIVQITHKPLSALSDGDNWQSIGADSLDKVQIIMALEEKHDIEILDEDIATIKDMRSFIDLLEKKVNK